MALVTEGATRLPIHDDQLSGSEAGPGTHDRERPFYNPAMVVNRDLSMLVVEAWAKHRGRELDVADVLAGAGARSLRLANEVQAPIIVHANDGDPNAIDRIHEGRASLGIEEERLQTTRGAAHAFLAARRYDIIDIDPFGSPMPLLDAAMRAVRHDGLLCITATDTAALSGTYPRVARRRYGAWHGLHKMPWRSEVGLRILSAAVVRSAGRHDRAARPVLSVCAGHWMRVVMHVTDGRAASDKAAKALGEVWATEGDLAAMGDRAPAGDYAGPIDTRPLHDPTLLTALQPEAHAIDRRTEALVADLQAEAEAPAFWASMPHLRRAIGRDLPKRNALMQAMRDAGFSATRTHLDPEGIRTDAGFSEIVPLVPATKEV